MREMFPRMAWDSPVWIVEFRKEIDLTKVEYIWFDGVNHTKSFESDIALAREIVEGSLEAFSLLPKSYDLNEMKSIEEFEELAQQVFSFDLGIQ